MENDQQKIDCAGVDEYRIYCDICYKFAIDRYYNNNLKPQTHINNILEKSTTKLKISFQII